MAWHLNSDGSGIYPADFARLGGIFSGFATLDINIFPTGTTTIPLHGSYFGSSNPADPGPHSYPGDVHHWEIRDYTGTVIATGGAISSGSDFPVPTGIRNTPGWYRVDLYNASGDFIGGGMFVLEPAGTPWPTGASGNGYFGARIGLPGGRMSIANIADPGADTHNFGLGWWGGGATPSLAVSPDEAAAEVGTTTVWDTVDPVRKANRVNLINYTDYSYTPPSTGTIAYNPADAEQAGVRATAARYAGKGFIHEGRNEPTPSAAYARVSVAFARAVWDGDPTAKVALVCPVTFNKALIPGLTQYYAALNALLTTPEKAKVVITFHDYNVSYDDLLLGDECWADLNAVLDAAGFGDHMRIITEQDGFEAAHYGAGDLVRQLARYSTSNMLSQSHGVERERQFLYYLQQHGHFSFFFWHLSTSGQPHPVIAWELTQERETRRMAFVERHDAGDDARTVLSLRYAKAADGTGVVQAKASGRPTAPVTYQLATSGGASMPTTLTAVDFQGRTSTVPVVSGQVDVTLGPLPMFLRLPANVTATLVPTTRTRYTELAFITSVGGVGSAPSPVNSATSRESFGYDDASPDGDVKFAWQASSLFTDGQWVGVQAASPFTLTGVGLYCPIPSHDVGTILEADIQVKVAGTWVPATKDGDPVRVDEPTPYQIVATTPQDGVQGWYLGYDPGVHSWVLDVDPVVCTGWRAVVRRVTYGESPTLETLMAAPGPHATPNADTHAGFGTEQPSLYVTGLDTYGSPVTSGGGAGGTPGVYYLTSA